MVTLHTNFGDIKIKLDFDKAPITAENFLNYCKNGFYNNTIFHRVIDGFMIQGGGMESGMREKATNAPIQNEANNRLSNKRGTIAMARTSDPHSATAQFFINVADNDFLNYRSKEMFGREVVQEWGYAVFGEVVEGMDVVDKIQNLLFEPPDFVTDRALFTPPAADQPQFEQPQYRLPGRKPPDLPKHRFGQQFVVPRHQSSMRRLNVQRTEAFAGS